MISPTTQATLLLTARIGTTGGIEHQPLDLREWNVLAHWLDGRGLRPEDLIQGDADAILSDWEESKIDRERLFRLLDRGPTLALSVERWANAGIWIMGRSDAGYPKRLKERLLGSRPAVLFGAGEPSLLTAPGIAIVGSRDATVDELRFADDLGSVVSEAGYSVVSGGARGIDERAAQGAFRSGGRVVAIVAESLVKNVSKKFYRDHLMSESLVLATPFSPETGFKPGNAMARNKLIYCLSDAAIAVSSTNGSGGTFHGASINLRGGWVPLWVMKTEDPSSGNHVLAANGAHWLPPLEKLNVEQLIDPDWSPPDAVFNNFPLVPQTQSEHSQDDEQALPSLYQLFLKHWRLQGEGPVTSGTMASALGIHVKQAQEWLDLGVAEGLATKTTKPGKYQLIA